MLLELLRFGATFSITQTIAAIGFPIFILLLVPVRNLPPSSVLHLGGAGAARRAYASLFTTLARSSIHHHPVRHHRLTTTLEAEWAMLLGEDDLVERGKASTNRRSSQDVRRRTSFRSDPGGAKGEGIEMDRPVTDNKERPRSRRARSVTLNAVPTTPMVASVRNTTFSLVYLMAPASLIDELGCGDCIGRCALRAPVPHLHLVRCGPIPLVW